MIVSQQCVRGNDLTNAVLVCVCCMPFVQLRSLRVALHNFEIAQAQFANP